MIQIEYDDQEKQWLVTFPHEWQTVTGRGRDKRITVWLTPDQIKNLHYSLDEWGVNQRGESGVTLQ